MPTTPDFPATDIGHYRLLGELGSGGMGVVYLAEDTKLGRKIALKVLHPGVADDPARIERLAVEARAVAAVNHPNIVTIHSVEEADGRHFLTMELVVGSTLAQLIPPSGLDVAKFLGLAIPIADALRVAHGQGVVHRDLKPVNIMVDQYENVKILDFGLAELREGADGPSVDQESVTGPLPQRGEIYGTIPYMSPEQIHGTATDPRGDIFSLGIVMYEMLTCTRPFHGADDTGTIAAILTKAPATLGDVRSDVPTEIAQLIEKCLEKDVDLRPQGMDVVLQMLRAVESGSAMPAGASLSTAVAVLPFKDLSPDQDQEYFCAGMAEELIFQLSSVEGLRVTSRTSTQRFRESGADITDIGEQLQVATILEGSLRKSADRLRITAALVDARQGVQLWAERFDGHVDEVFEVQDQIASKVIERLRSTLSRPLVAELSITDTSVPPVAAAPGREPVNLQAYESYLKGRHRWNQRTAAGLARSVEHFEAAIARSPEYARAYAGLADAYITLGIYGERPPKEVMPEAMDAVGEAMKIDDALADVHTSLACIRAVFEWNWADAGRSFTRAIEIDPDYPTAHHWHAVNQLVPLRRFDEARREIQIAQRLDPLSLPIAVTKGMVEYFAHDFERAIEGFQEALEIEPSAALARLFLGLTRVELGHPAEAVADLQLAAVVAPGNPEVIAGLGYAYARGGDLDAATERLDVLRALADERFVSPALVAQIYAGLGEPKQALDWLDKAASARSVDLAWLAVRPVFVSLHRTPRFAATLTTMGLLESGA